MTKVIRLFKLAKVYHTYDVVFCCEAFKDYFYGGDVIDTDEHKRIEIKGLGLSRESDLFDKGTYHLRGNYLVNYCPFCGAKVEYDEEERGED